MIDVLIAGGGPAGLATAIFAGKAGMRVIVVEPHTGPIDKACGEGIMPAGKQLLDRMGVSVADRQMLAGVRYHRNGTVATGRFQRGLGVGIRRTELSEALWRRATELGVERRQGRIREVEMLNDSVLATGIRARWLVAADGLHSTLRQSLGIPLLKTRPGRFGVRRHFETDIASDFVDVYLGDEDEAYVTPIGGGKVGVAILSGIPKRFEEGITQFPDLMASLKEPVGRAMGAGPFARFAHRVCLDRVALVGDAAGFLDPITGEGIRLGFESAELLVACLQTNSLNRYSDGWHQIVRRYRLVTSGILTIRRNRFLRDAMVPVLRMTPGMFSGLLGLLGNP